MFRQLLALLELRWRLSFNQARRLGLLQMALLVSVRFSLLLAAIGAFFVALVGGTLWLRDASANLIMLVWDGVSLGFVFMLCIELMTEIRRKDLLTLKKLLHLPVSIRAAFLLNFMSSCFSESIIILGPLFLGLCGAFLLLLGPPALMMLLLSVSFLLMAMAAKYLVAGVAAEIMAQNRWRKAFVALVSVLAVGLPAIPVSGFIWAQGMSDVSTAPEMRSFRENKRELHAAHDAGDLSDHNYRTELALLRTAEDAARDQIRRHRFERLGERLVRLHPVFPLAWLSYGARETVLGQHGTSILFGLGMTGIAAIILWISYRRTIVFYTRGQTRRQRAIHGARVDSAAPLARGKLWQLGTFVGALSRLPPQRSSIVATTLRLHLRSPEGQLSLGLGLLASLVFSAGMLLLRSTTAVSGLLVPLGGVVSLGVAVSVFLLLGGNMFGFDRGEFLTWILQPVERSEVLLGRNLGMFLVAASVFAIMVFAQAMLLPMRLDHLLATLVQLPGLLLFAAVAGNLISIVAPTPVALIDDRAQQPRLVDVFIQFSLLPLAFLLLVPACACIAGEAVISAYFGWSFPPLYLAASLLQLPVAVKLYRRALATQGRFFQRREGTILHRVQSC